MLTGFGKHQEAMNILLANRLLGIMSQRDCQKIARTIVRIQQDIKGNRAGSAAEVLEALSGEQREVQMQFVALACNALGVAPHLSGQSFFEVRNPYTVRDIPNGKIELAQDLLSRTSGERPSWPGSQKRINFVELHKSGEIIEARLE